MVVPVTEGVTVEVEMVDIELRPNHAFNRTRAHAPSFWHAAVGAGRLTWSC